VVVAPHCDVAAVDSALATGGWRRALVLTDSVFSADGDLAPLAALHDVVRRHGALLLVDDAHATGVAGPAGRGAVAAAGLTDQPDVVITTTLSKSLGSQGGAVLGSRALIDHVIDTARAFIFDTALTPVAVATAAAALQLIIADPTLPRRVCDNAQRLHQLAVAAGLESTVPAAAVVSVLIGDPDAAVAAAGVMAVYGLRVGCFRPPSVPASTSRLRLTARADLTDAEIDMAGAGLRAVASVHMS